jgi:alpha-tubulin suppressor-like RCC1 family protein
MYRKMKFLVAIVVTMSAFVSVCFGQGNNVVAVGSYHTCLGSGGQMRCWGMGLYGQLGTGSTANLGDAPNEMSLIGRIAFAPSLGKVTSVSAGEMHTCAFMDTGKVVCFGIGALLGIGSYSWVGCGGSCLSTVDLSGITFKDTFLVTAISSGGNHNCALFSNGKVRWYIFAFDFQ